MASSDAIGWLKQHRAPVTLSICGLLILGFLAVWMNPVVVMGMLNFNGFSLEIWRLFTYAFMPIYGIIGLVFTVWWMLWIGSEVERDHGSQRFFFLWLIACLLGIVPVALVGGPAMGVLVPEAILTSIFAARNPEMVIRIYCIIPIKMKWLALLTTLVVFFAYAASGATWYFGLLAVLGCIIGWLYGSNRIPGLQYAGAGRPGSPKQSKAQKNKEEAYYSDVFIREKERADRERLRKLLEGSDGSER